MSKKSILVIQIQKKKNHRHNCLEQNSHKFELLGFELILSLILKGRLKSLVRDKFS